MKFGQFAREALQEAIKDGRVMAVDWQERRYVYAHTGNVVKGLAVGRRGLYTMVQDSREVIVQEFE